MTKEGTIRFYENVDWRKIEEMTTPDVKDYIKQVHKYLLSNIKGNVLVLEVGCGTGDFIRDIAAQVNKIVGIDSSKKLLKITKKNLSGIKNISLINSDLESASIPKAYFDFVISMWTLPNIDDPINFITKIKRVIKRDGVIFIDTYSEKATKQRIKMYKSIGLSVIGVNKEEILIKEGLTEKIYMKKSLKALFKNAGLEVDIINIHKMGYLCKATNPK